METSTEAYSGIPEWYNQKNELFHVVKNVLLQHFQIAQK
jgi:hypothetical protein